MSSTHLIRRLLSRRNEPSRSEKDDVFAKILVQVAPKPRSRNLVFLLLPGLLLAGVVALVLVPLATKGGSRQVAHADFGARGHEEFSSVFSVACAGGQSSCEPSDTLAFDLTASAGYGYFAAFAMRGDGTIIWYFPESEDSESLPIADRLQEGALERAVALGAEHAPGRYKVFGFFSSQPLTRTQIREEFVVGASEIGNGTAVFASEFAVR